MNYPKKYAYSLGSQLKKFRAASEDSITSEINPKASEDMKEVIRQIDWSIFNTIINQLQFCYKQRQKVK